MSGFKRDSGSRFARGDQAAPSANNNSRPVPNPTGNTGGRSFSGGRSNTGASGQKPKFTSLGSLTVPKSVSDDISALIHDELKNSDVRLNAKVYLPKGVNEITIKRDQMLLVTFKVGDKDPDFVVGKILIPND